MPPLQQAHEYIRQGDKIKARAILASLVQSEPQNANAWLLLATVLDDPKQIAYCTERAQSVLQTANVTEVKNTQPPVAQPPIVQPQIVPPQIIQSQMDMHRAQENYAREINRASQLKAWGMVLSFMPFVLCLCLFLYILWS